MCNYSFFVENGGTRFAFDELDKLQDFANGQNQAIESFDIKLGDHSPKLSDEIYDTLSKLGHIGIDDILEYLD